MLDIGGVSLLKTAPKAEKILKAIITESSISHILCQYGTFASKYMKVWHETELPLFIHFHGYDVFFDLRLADQPEKHFHSKEYLACIKDLEKRATFIAGSQFLKSQLVGAGISADRVVVKYYGVPVPEKNRIHEKRTDIQILHLGRLVDFKSPDRTIMAFEIAKSKGFNGHLVMVGDGPLKITCEILRLRSPYKDSIRMLNSISPEEAQLLYSESDIFTQHNITGEITRQSEGFGVSIVEAMASGIPIVGTRNGGVLETVVDGQTGILTSPGDVEAQANAFLQLEKNPDLRQQMGDAGRARVSTFFNPQQEAEQLQVILNHPINKI
jgi:colanic acid/amylovoran biosynthesis glycosyltransferase